MLGVLYKIFISHDLILITYQNLVCDFFMTEFGKILRLNDHNSAENQ